MIMKLFKLLKKKQAKKEYAIPFFNCIQQYLNQFHGVKYSIPNLSNIDKVIERNYAQTEKCDVCFTDMAHNHLYEITIYKTQQGYNWQTMVYKKIICGDCLEKLIEPFSPITTIGVSSDTKIFVDNPNKHKSTKK